MPNLRIVDTSPDEERTRHAPWRSFGSVVSSLVAQAEARQADVKSDEEFGYAAMAWAAE